jgi:hypothetical protein
VTAVRLAEMHYAIAAMRAAVEAMMRGVRR